MKSIKKNAFKVSSVQEQNYCRLHVTHPAYRGRIRKRIGSKSSDEIEEIILKLRFELAEHFRELKISKYDTESFIDNFISLHIKGDASVFDFTEEFVESKRKSFNRNTRKELSSSTITGYMTAFKYFERYLLKGRLSPHPTHIDDAVLNGFYEYLSGKHNYKVKVHTRVKSLLRYIDEVKGIKVARSYKLSTFTEIYDNQMPEDDDIALTSEEVIKLIALRRKIASGGLALPTKPISSKIPAGLQMQQYNTKKDNMKRVLDCFLFMIGTGMYYSDIIKSPLYFSMNGKNRHLKYRRAKNGSLCKAVPILHNDEVFITEEIISQYGIVNGRKFPLKLSLTHFNIHLKTIARLAGIDHGLNNKMARKTFASILYFDRGLPLKHLHILLGHKSLKNTAHYLRISDDDIADEITELISGVKVDPV